MSGCGSSFSDEKEAKLQLRELEIGVHNQGILRRSISTILDESIVRKCEVAIQSLGDKYDIEEAVAFFLKYKTIADITLEKAIEKFIDFQQSQVRENTLNAYRRDLDTFKEFVAGEPLVGQITHEDIERFLDSKRPFCGVL